MPASAAPVAAARAAAARGDHRLLAYWQGGFAISLVVPGATQCDADANRGGVRKGRYRVFAISLDNALTRQCCDRWVPDACGFSQQNYAAAYNLEMIRVSRRRTPRGC